ncbi:MAG: hypothetical protein ACYCTD_08805 [bacterium]
MKDFKIILFVFVFACLSVFVYLPKASASAQTSTQQDIRISMLSRIPGYRVINDYGDYFTNSHTYIKNIVSSIETQAPSLGANACISLRILLIGHVVGNDNLKHAAFIGYCEYVKLSPKKMNKYHYPAMK